MTIKTDMIKKSNTKSEEKYSILGFWLIWAVICLLYIAMRINLLNIPLDRDEGIFGYTGQVILDHGLPYKDAIEHKPPIVFYLYALALLCVKPTPVGIHTFLHFYNFLTVVALFFLTKIYTNSRSTGLWTAFIYTVFSSSPFIQGFTASTEMFMLLPLTLCLLLVILAVHKNKSYFLVLSGVCGALACWTKPTGILMILFIMGYLMLSQVVTPHKQCKRVITMLHAFLLWNSGFVFISLLIAGYFYYYGIFDEFIYWSFTHNYYYTKAKAVSDNLPLIPKIFQIAKEIAEGNFFVIAIGLLTSLINVLKKKTEGYFTLGFIFFSLLAIVPGHTYKHYFAQIAPAIAIAGGMGFSLITDSIKKKKVKVATSVLCSVMIIVIPLSVHSNYYFSQSPDKFMSDFFGINPFPESVDLAKFISQRTGSNDSVFIFGSEPQILLYAQRKSATSFAMLYPLTRIKYPRYKDFQKKAWDEINSNKPKYIIIFTIPTSILWDGVADLELQRNTWEMCEKEYYLEAVMTREKPKGKLLLVSEIKNAREQLERYKFPIYIYRNK